MDKNEKVYTINAKTGEKKDGYFVYIAYPKPKITGNRWMMTFQDSLAIIAEDKDLTGQTLRVFMLSISELEFENYITIKQVDMAKRLSMHKTDVSKSMRILVDKGIILKVKEGTTSAYKLNPTYGWKGKVSNLEKERKRIHNLRMVKN
ncbi:MAG: replication/maintenance protein RepL [Methylococcales bacterium]|nr:replication/maintenance protein RepL [Methylococcales bacterium]MCK5925925.1 replication/maintenance protein RepL [Methylococcales bacterium]